MTECCLPNERVRLKYGRGEVELPLTGAREVSYLYENEMPVLEDLAGAFSRAVAQPDAGLPLDARISAGEKITIIISDITRFWMRQDLVCELLVKYLEGLGVRDRDMCVLVALGTHRPMTAVELEKLASAYVYARVEVLNHDCDAPDLVSVGTGDSGNEIFVNPLAVGRRVIVISGTVHHLMAGYGGGRKSILPGIAGRETIRRNHTHALAPDAPHSSDRVGSGRLRFNPIDEDMRQAAAFVAPVFGLNIVVDSQMRISRLFSGDFEAAWLESCRFCQQSYGKVIEHQADTVIVSCGGYPKDLNLYQSVKALLNGIHALKPGGDFIFLAECPEGGGARDFFDWIVPLNRGTLDPALRENFTIAGYIFYASCEAIARAGHFRMLSEIDPETVRGMGIESFKTPEALAAQLNLAGRRVCVIPFGGGVLPQPAEENARLNAEVNA